MCEGGCVCVSVCMCVGGRVGVHSHAHAHAHVFACMCLSVYHAKLRSLITFEFLHAPHLGISRLEIHRDSEHPVSIVISGQNRLHQIKK